jgi:two-component system OmpR family sensor kinase
MRGPRTLTARLVMTVVVLMIAVTVLISVVTTVTMRSYLLGRLDQQVQGNLQRVLHDPGGGQDGGPGPGLGIQLRTITAVFPDDGTNTGYVIGTNEDEEAYRKKLSKVALSELDDVPADDAVHSVDVPALGRYRVVAQKLSDGTVVAGLPTAEVDDTLAGLLWREVLLGLLGVLAAAVAGAVVVRRQLRPLTEVAATAHAVAELPLASDTEVSERVPERLIAGSAEVAQVGTALNTLLDHVETALAARHRSEQQVRQFVADASHELRTPLSTIHGYAELSRRTPGDAVALSGAMTKVETEADRMSRLVEDMLLLARLDSGRPLERGEVDLTKLLLESVADARVVDAQQGPAHRWQLQLPEAPIVVAGDEQRLHQLFTNLLGNARHHTPPGTTVTVSAAPGPDEVVVEVHDDGPGLPPGLADHAFERFTRGDSSRTRASGGAGLGLSLVAAIAQAHQGTASVSSQAGATTFRIQLPTR